MINSDTLALFVYSRTTWSDYFTGSPTLLQSTEFGTKQTPSDTNLHVLNCLFRSITSTSGGGGALYCTSSILLVESSSFFSCKASSRGGAIEFLNRNNGQCALHKVCGYDCYTTSSTYGQFVYIAVQNTISNKNCVNYSSIAQCVNDIYRSEITLYIDFGNICCQSANLSMNKCYYKSAVFFYPVVDSNSVTCSVSYSSFTDNIANGYTCIYLYQTGAKYEMKSCNVLRNTQGTLGTEGTIYTYGYLTIEDSCILENAANYIFRVSSSSYTITLLNCTVDKTSNNGCLTTQNTVTKSFILALNHISTRNCHSEYDSAGTLTPNLHTPSSTKQIRCFTHVKYIYQPRLTDVVSLNNILIFNFIHPYASSDVFY
jgi:hypothetical protein